jgi:hypothetical protein
VTDLGRAKRRRESVTCALDYLYYKDDFPTCALARYSRFLQSSQTAC